MVLTVLRVVTDAGALPDALDSPKDTWSPTSSPTGSPTQTAEGTPLPTSGVSSAEPTAFPTPAYSIDATLETEAPTAANSTNSPTPVTTVASSINSSSLPGPTEVEGGNSSLVSRSHIGPGRYARRILRLSRQCSLLRSNPSKRCGRTRVTVMQSGERWAG
jgi:hypothetical protein